MKTMLFFACATVCIAIGAQNPVAATLNNGNYRLENKFIRAEISPEAGGRVIAMIDKRNNFNYTLPHADDGIGGELSWSGFESTANSPWYGKAYVGSTDVSDPAEAKITLSRNGSEAAGNMKWVTIHKTYRLGKDSSALRLDYRITVEYDAMRNVLFQLWTHSTSQVKGIPATIFLPTTQGVVSIPYNSSSPANESFTYDLTGGWGALLLDRKSAGIVYQSNYPDLMCFYNWQGSTSNSMEFLYRSQSVPNGKSFDTSIYYTLFTGLPVVDGAGKGWVGAFSGDRKKPSGVRIYAPADGKATLQLAIRACPGELEKQLGSFGIDGKAGEVSEIPLQYTLPQSGTHELIARLTGNDGVCHMTMTLPLSSNGKNAGFTRRPDAPPRGNLKERYGSFVASSDAVKDCFEWNTELPLIDEKPWLKPYAGGQIRLLALTGQDNSRELIELAGRMDAKLSTCSFSGSGRMAWSPTWGHNGGHGETNQYLRQLLNDNYDCILLAGIQIGKAISAENMKLIAEKVKNGTGLVTVMPTHIPQSEAALFPAVPRIQQMELNKPQLAVKTDSFVRSGMSPVCALPLTGLPTVAVFPYSSVKAVVTAAGQPLLSLGKFGKGRTALFSWLVGRDTNTSTGGVMPFLADEPTYPYQNYYYGMVIKTILDVTGRQPAIHLATLECAADGKLSLEVNNSSGSEVDVDFAWEARHVSKHPAGSGTFRKTLRSGMNRWVEKIAVNPLNGQNFIDLRLRSGNVGLDFGAASLVVNVAGNIRSVTVPSKVYVSGETINAQVKATVGTLVRAVLTDIYGRDLSAASAVIGADGVAMLPLPLKNLYANYGRIVFTLEAAGKLSDRRIVPVDMASDATVSRKWDQFQFTVGWPRRFDRTMPFYLFETYQEALRELGFNAVYGLGISMFPIKRLDAQSMTFIQRGGFRNIIEAVARIQKGYYLPYYSKWGESDYNFRIREVQDVMEKYSKTHDTNVLRRNPSLDCDEYLSDYSAGLTELVRNCQKKWYAALYDLADEFCYTWANAPVDFDFSPGSLAKFRLWLQKQYASLAELNAEWKRNYRNWDEVMPSTGWEARNRGVYSGWAMHRLYNNKVFADFVKVSRDAIHRADPMAKISLSGTRPPASYTGCDWQQLMPLMDALFPYGYDGQPEIHRSFKKIPMSGWSGYVVDGDGTACWKTIWGNMFNGHYGVAVFSGPLMIAPDLTPTPAGLVLRDVTAQLRRGVGSLLFHSGRPQAKIAIHYSFGSILASWIEQVESDFVDARLNWIDLLKSKGYEFRFVGASDIENGALKRDGYSFLILPMSLALSGKECDAINSFAATGGGVIADLPPGGRNQRCAPAAAGRLNKALSARNSMLLNRKLTKMTSKGGQELGDLVEAKFKSAGIAGRSELLTVLKGDPQVFLFSLAPAGGELIGLWNDKPGQLKFNIPSGGVLYDVLAGKIATNHTLELPGGRPALLAILPYKVAGINLAVKADGGKICVNMGVTPSRGKALRHVFRCSFNRPGKPESRIYTRVIEASDGTAVYEVFPALNEVGVWEVNVEEIVSGLKTKVVCDFQTK